MDTVTSMEETIEVAIILLEAMRSKHLKFGDLNAAWLITINFPTSKRS